ncbi:MAG TPA: extracellular solute-binding protein [Candidatus Atribacteria bacterium]|nr:extracellular solute-binding protein [Candidatus Atribacteria bacterium]
MFKKLFYLIVVLVLVSSISVYVFGQEKEIELSVLNYLDITSPEAVAWDATVEAFNAKYPNIRLKIENSFGEAYHQKLAALAAAGDLPDVMYLWPGGRSAEIYKNELTEDLYPFLGADKDKFVPAAVAPQWDGKLYELPIGITATHVMYVNTKLLSDLGLTMPKTYDELVAMVPKIKEAGLYPILMANKAAWVMQSCLFSALVGRIGGQDWLNAAIAGEASFTDQEFVNSLTLVKDLYDTGLLPPQSIQLEYADGPNLFATGRSPFMIDGDWRVGAVAPLLTEEAQENFELTVFPDIVGQKGESGSTSTVVATGFGMKAGLSKEKAEAAWKWIYFFAGPQASEIRLIEQGMIPTYIMDLSPYDIPPLAVKRGAFYPEHSGTDVLDNVIAGEPINILNIGLQELALGNTTPEKLATDFEAAMKVIR